jgi:hypothetical protein
VREVEGDGSSGVVYDYECYDLNDFMTFSFRRQSACCQVRPELVDWWIKPAGFIQQQHLSVRNSRTLHRRKHDGSTREIHDDGEAGKLVPVPAMKSVRHVFDAVDRALGSGLAS